MYKQQSSLPEAKANKNPQFYMTKVAEVTGNKDFYSKGVLYARFTKGGRPCPVYVYEGGVNTKPEEGDSIVVGYLEGNKTTPFFLGFGANAYASANFLKVHKDGIAVQFPKNTDDRDEHMTDDDFIPSRAFVRIYKDAVEINFPMDADGAETVNIKATATQAIVSVGPTTKLRISDGLFELIGGDVSLSGSTPVARQGDTVQVSVPTIGTCSGTITGGSSTVTAG